MTESKIQLTERLRREGRWDEASRFKDTAVKDFRSKGMKRAEAAEAAWEAMAAAFPPQAVAEGPADPVDAQEHTPTPASAEGASAPLPSPRVKIPPDWASMAPNANPKAEVEWVAANLTLCRGRRTGAPDTMDLSRAASPAPSLAAVGMLEAAISSPNKFMLEVYPKFVGADQPDSEEEKIKEEKMRIGEMEAILKGFEDNMDAKLRADVPGVLQERVRDMLSNWGQRCRVSLPADAQARLDSSIVGLLQDSLRAFAPSSGGD